MEHTPTDKSSSLVRLRLLFLRFEFGEQVSEPGLASGRRRNGPGASPEVLLPRLLGRRPCATAAKGGGVVPRLHERPEAHLLSPQAVVAGGRQTEGPAARHEMPQDAPADRPAERQPVLPGLRELSSVRIHRGVVDPGRDVRMP